MSADRIRPDGAPSCEYISGTPMGIASEVEQGGMVFCRARARVVVVPADVDGPASVVETRVCRRHARWLTRSEHVERDWERVGEVDR